LWEPEAFNGGISGEFDVGGVEELVVDKGKDVREEGVLDLGVSLLGITDL